MTCQRRFVLFVLFVVHASGALCLAQVTAVARVGFTVDDIDRSLDFYTKVLPFRVTSDDEVTGEAYEKLTGVFGLRARVVRLRLGAEEIELTQYLTPQGRLIPRDSRSNDRWFQHIAIVVTDMDTAYAHLRRHKVKFASTGPQRLPNWNPNAGGIRAFYFRDPDDHVLEIIWFPEGKGDPRWQRRPDADDPVFLGIDHTAIVVADTDESLSFYRDLLGLRVAGGSENYGDEQARLNNVRDARLRITTTKAKAGPGVEFLQYVSPGAGRDYPADSRSNDLWHWQTTVIADDAAALLRAARERGHAIVSDDLADLTGTIYRAPGGFVVRDPDGHAVQVLQK